MSANRGTKRNSFGNRNFGRSGGGGVGNPSGRGNMGGGLMGGPGGSAGGLVGGGGGGGGSGVNPWESGVMPGRGLLPTPNNNLSLNSSQALLSNLLSNLLRTHQDAQPQVPSLLSLGNTLNGPGPNFGGQQNFGPGRFNDRPMRHGMKNQRPQPYNKMGNRARDGVAGRRGPSSQQSRVTQSANQRSNGNQNQHRNDKSSKPNPASKQIQTAKKEQQEVKTSDKEKAETIVAKSDETENTTETKRDWKDEKKEVENKQDVVNKVEERSKESNSENAEKSTTEDDKKPDDNQGSGGKKSATRHAESRYADVPMNQMFCHVCNKHMWDGFSFENHLRGRAHQLMMEKLDESYKLKVDLMRHELRVAEEQRELSLTNSKRRGKKVSVDLNVREYCTMCDLNFFGTLSSHRKSEKHQQLKTFLHPRCFPCMKEFPSRIEYDEHCLTPAHMKSNAQSEEQRKNKKKDKLAKGESEVRTAEDEDKDCGPDNKSNDNEEELPVNAEYVTDFMEDTIPSNYRIPSLKYCRQNEVSVGKSMVKEVQGWHCEKCRRFMLTEADMAAHLRSVTHYRKFVHEFKALSAAAAAATAAAEADTAEKETTEETATSDAKLDDTKEDEDDDYDGDWKRRKVDHSNKDEDDETKDDMMDTTYDSAASKKEDGDDKYDPLEADADSEEDNENHEKTSENPKNNVTEDVKKEPVDKMWADIDNDNDQDIGNLLDDDIEDKDFVDEPETQKTEPETKVETPTPEVVLVAVDKTPVPQVKSPSSAYTTPTANTPSNASTPHTNVSMNDTPQSKSPRGRGYGRGRGSQRARRSRR